jgi:hypothetical protein
MSRFEQLVRVYSEIGVPLDRLPCSQEMDRLVASISDADGTPPNCREVWWNLLDLRKGGKLPKVGRRKLS